jgi:hypothetical protein
MSTNTKPKDNSTQIQQSIQAIIHINEREKINIRINQERYTKKLREYNKLLGKPSSPSKEQRLSLMKQKMEEIKNRQIFSPNYGKKIRISSPEEEIKSLKKSASMNEIKLNSIKSEVNKQSLENDRILREINLIRRDKLIQKNKLQKITEENDDIDHQIKALKQKNKRSLSRLNYADLEKAKVENKILEENFKKNREHLEYKYHQVIQDNIRREKNKINELGKQRMANAVFADNARKNTGKDVNSILITDRDEIQDRIPILDGLLDKWNHTIKFKKQMLNKYITNSAKIKDTLDKLLLVLGLENYEDLPQVYEMEEAQNAKIDEVLSKVSNEVDLLKEQKELMEKKISKLQNTKKETNNQNEMNLKEREINIETLKRLNEDLLNQINRKKTLFNDMEECTFNFLNKMENTYLSDFVVKKMNIEETSKLNETNVLDYLGSVYCYIQLINDFNENVQAKKEIKQNINMSSLANKSIENLDKEIKFKLSKFNYNNCLNKVKKDAKQKNAFDDVIRRLANEIVKDVNGNYDMNEDSSKFGTNVSSTGKNKKKQNFRYSSDN